MKKIAILSLFFVGCNCGMDPSQPAKWHYNAGCLKVSSHLELNEDAVVYNSYLAENIMEPKIPDFCDRFKDIPIFIRNDQTWNEYGTEVEGYNTVFSGIQLNWHMDDLVHELFHTYDDQHLKINTITHTGWDTNGYNHLNNVYNVHNNKCIEKYIYNAFCN